MLFGKETAPRYPKEEKNDGKVRAVPPERGTAFVAAARGDGAAPDGHDPEEASFSDTGLACMAEPVTGGSARCHIPFGDVGGVAQPCPEVSWWRRRDMEERLSNARTTESPKRVSPIGKT